MRKYSLSISAIGNEKYGVSAQSWIENNGERSFIGIMQSSAANDIEQAIIVFNEWKRTQIGAWYRRTGELDKNGNYYLEYSQEVRLSNDIVINYSNVNEYNGSEGWYWYEDGEVVTIATPTTWEKMKNWFK